MFIKPKFNTQTTEVNPKITPKIRGIVFLIPWLKPECTATILFGPGEQLVTNINKQRDSNSGCITMLQANHFQLFEMDEQAQLYLPYQ